MLLVRGVLMDSGRAFGGVDGHVVMMMCLGRLLVHLSLEDQRHRAELLDHRDDRPDDEAGDDRRKHDRAEQVH